MRVLRSLIPAAVLVVSLFVVPAAAQSKAVPQMAGILMNLNHFPSDAEKATLKTIAADKMTTAHEKTVAEVLLVLQHTPSAADKARLEAIVKDTAAPEGVRTLAGVLASLNHTASAADKERLKKLAV
jgi:hypothetical protein